MKKLLNTILVFLFFNISFIYSQTGCTDSAANNYSSSAITNNGNCTYDKASISPSNSILLSNLVNETYGTIEWN